jgi:hypothetical protein
MIFGVVITKNFDQVVADRKKNETYKPFLEGRDIDRYKIKFADKYLRYERSLLHRPRTKEVFEVPEKLLVQRISGGRRPLKAAYDNHQFYDKESINNIILGNSGLSAKFILALLNSNLFSWYYATKFTNASKLTVNVSKAYLQLLPVKMVSSDIEKRVVDLSDKMIQLGKELAKNEGERARQRFEETDLRINQLVYEIYELSESERHFIDRSVN